MKFQDFKSSNLQAIFFFFCIIINLEICCGRIPKLDITFTKFKTVKCNIHKGNFLVFNTMCKTFYRLSKLLGHSQIHTKLGDLLSIFLMFIEFSSLTFIKILGYTQEYSSGIFQNFLYLYSHDIQQRAIYLLNLLGIFLNILHCTRISQDVLGSCK